MSRPALVTLVTALAFACVDDALHDRGTTKPLTPEERDMRDRLRRDAERRRWLAAEEYQARTKEENDAAAAPYREARRKRAATKLAQGHWQHREVPGVPT